MPLPELSREVWLRITTFLDPQSLQALSQVSHAFHGLATDDMNFQRFIPDTERAKANPILVYRRIRAFEFPPNQHLSVRPSSDTRILCTAHDSLILLDVPAYRLLALPSGVTVSVRRLLGLTASSLTHDDLPLRHVVLPDRCIGFVGGYRPSRLSIWNIETGQVTTQKLDGVKKTYGRSSRRKLINGRLAAVAGENGQWIMYYINDKTCCLVNWRDGDVVRVYTDIIDEGTSLMSECSAICGQSVVGFVLKSPNTCGELLMKDLNVVGFDGAEKRFRVHADFKCHVAIRSLDRNAVVLIGSIPEAVRTRELTVIQVGMKDMFIPRVFMSRNCVRQAELQDNGRVIVSSCNPLIYNHNRGSNSDKLMLWLEQDSDNPDHPQRYTLALRGGWTPIWSIRAQDTGYLVRVRPREGDIEFLKLVRDYSCLLKKTCLKSWSIREKIVDACVVADHFIVATCLHGRLYIWHFDHFCRDDNRTYACQGLVPKELGTVASSVRE